MGEVQPAEARREVQERYERSYGSGETVFEPGDPARSLFVVQSGQIEILRATGSGTRCVDAIRPGEFFGEMAVVLGGRHSVRAVASQASRLLEIDRETFHSMCTDRPEIALRVIERLTTRVLQLEDRVGSLAVNELVRPVVAHLMDSAVVEGDEERVETTLKGIAEAVGLSLLDTHRAIQELIDRKLLRLDQDQLWIPDRDALGRYPAEAA